MLSFQHLPRPFLPIRKTSSSTSISHTPIRSASLLRRPKRPYTFTQLVQLSDGSTFTHRTTSPRPVYRSNKDTRNSPLWNPSSAKLLTFEADEAGRLRAFRDKFGRGWDAERMDVEDGQVGDEGNEEDREESLMDLISGFAKDEVDGKEGGGRKEVRERIERENQEMWDKKAAEAAPVKKKGGDLNRRS